MKLVVITSGGLDSSVLLHSHLLAGDEVRALGINYGQRHRIELSYAKKHAAHLNVPYIEVDLSNLRDVLPGSSQTDPRVKVPHGHYAEESMKATIVPNRNMILLAVALGHALSYKFDGVSYAAHSGDHAIYPDCRPEFVDALNQAAFLCDWQKVAIFRPFIGKTKSDIVVIGSQIGTRMDLTFSCYEGKDQHCGLCGTCVERKEAFVLAGIPDPTEYSAK